MKKFEFKVVSAPEKAQKFTDLDPGEDAYNCTVANLMNELGSDGWEFTGAETLPEPKRMFGGRRATRSVLVFRREIVPLEQAELEKARSSNVMLLKNDEAVRPRRIRKIKSPPFVRHTERQNDLPPEEMKA
jgi:hypothetical protein